MASGLSSGQDTALMTHQLGTTAYTLPTAISIALCTTAFGNNKVFGNEFTAVNSNYVRIYAGTGGTAQGVGATNWSIAAFVASTGVVATNLTQVSFLAASGSAFPQTLATVAFMSLLSGGSLLFFADLASTQSIAATIIVAFFVSDISFTLN